MTWEWIPLLIVVGFALLAFEIFVPGMILATTGTLCLAASVVIAFKLYGALFGSALLLFEILALIVAATRWVHWFPKTAMGRRIVLQETSGNVPVIDRDQWLGRAGIVVATCRPCGIAEFDRQRHDVISEGSFIEPGQAVKVVAIEGNKITVRAT